MRSLPSVVLLAILAGSLGCDASNPSDALRDTVWLVDDESRVLYTMSGKVSLNRDCMTQKNASGVLVRVLPLGKTALTDSAGRWSIDSVPFGRYDPLISGNYELRFERSGYYTEKLVVHAGNWYRKADTLQVQSPIIYGRVTYGARFEGDPVVTEQRYYTYRDSTVIDSNGVVVVAAKIKVDSTVYHTITFWMMAIDEQSRPNSTLVPWLLVAKSPDIQPDDPRTFSYATYGAPRSIRYPLSAIISSGIFTSLGLKSGDIYYVAAAGGIRCENSGPSTFYPGSGPFEVRSYVVP